MDPILPAIPPVRPRVVYDGDDRPLDEVVEELLADGVRGVVALTGRRQSGKTTALSLLAARFAHENSLLLLDNPTSDELAAVDGEKLCVIATWKLIQRPQIRLVLMAWRIDQLIEYAFERHPETCSAVMARLGAAGSRPWPPGLATILVDRYAENPLACNPEAEILSHVYEQFEQHHAVDAARSYALASQANRAATLLAAHHKLSSHRLPAAVSAWLLHELVVSELACDEIIELLTKGGLDLPSSMNSSLVERAARRCRDQPDAIATLRFLSDAPACQHLQSAVWSLLAAADPEWRPAPLARHLRQLTKATLCGVNWPGVDLRSAVLHGADFSDASLAGASLTDANLQGATFAGANLGNADLNRIRGVEADFSQANLTGAKLAEAKLLMACFVDANLQSAHLFHATLFDANLTRASFANADLSGAALPHATLAETDFTDATLIRANLCGVDLRTARLHGADLRQAVLVRANLEDIRLPDAKLQGAQLSKALLSGSYMPHACLQDADLSNAGLAEINWEHADLRGANLEGATFHMGSSRSGLVNSPIALEGNMTGFYNDDYEDRVFKRPEEIRKANLRGADLRGAKLGAINFYLVDLRDAKLDPDALRHARNCGAILDDVAAA